MSRCQSLDLIRNVLRYVAPSVPVELRDETIRRLFLRTRTLRRIAECCVADAEDSSVLRVHIVRRNVSYHPTHYANHTRQPGVVSLTLVLHISLEAFREVVSRGCLKVNHQLNRHESIFLVVRDILVHDLHLLQIEYQCLTDVLVLVVPRRGKTVQKPDCSGGSVLLFVERESGNVWFPSRCSRARDPLFFCGSSRSRLVIRSMCLYIRCTSFRHSSFLITVSCAYLAILSLWF